MNPGYIAAGIAVLLIIAASMAWLTRAQTPDWYDAADRESRYPHLEDFTEPDEVAPDQAWFWTPEWQAGECEADADFAAGRYQRFTSGEEFIASLDGPFVPCRECYQARRDGYPEAMHDECRPYLVTQ